MSFTGVQSVEQRVEEVVVVSTGEARAGGTSRTSPVPAQGVLFADDLPELDEEVVYRGPTACTAAGITYRQLDYWVKRLLTTGVSLQQIRGAIHVLRARGVDDLAEITLMSDGASVYECTSDQEVIDLLHGGQGVFGIAVGKVWREVEGELAALPSERADQEAPAAHADDELSARRAARLA